VPFCFGFFGWNLILFGKLDFCLPSLKFKRGPPRQTLHGEETGEPARE